MSTDGDVVRGGVPAASIDPMALEALARLEARIVEVERERDDALMEADGWHTHVARARAAESRYERLEGALRWIEEFSARMPRAGVDGGHTGFVHIERRARAALAEEPHADVPGAGQRGC